MPNQYTTLRRDENQARGIAQFALDFLNATGDGPAASVLAKVEQFHTDSIGCAVSALSLGANAPCVLRAEALEYPTRDAQEGVPCLASNVPVAPEKAILANCAAAREWDANGTNFGYNPRTGNTRGEFGHNDFYPVAVAAAQLAGLDGHRTSLAMICLDEIRGRLAESFALRDYKIDHVVHGAIASAAVYGAVLGATVDQIESAIGLVVAHYIPFRAIRSGHQLSDSKGASAAISAEAAVVAMRRAMRGFVGPADVFRNPQALFCLFEPPAADNLSPFDLVLATAGDDFAVMDMHFKLGLYEHQSAGAIEGLMLLLEQHPQVLSRQDDIRRIKIAIYEPAFSIIGDPAKRDPQTRQSADHSMLYIVGTLLRKAFQLQRSGWQALMLMPEDYSDDALHDTVTREWMQRIEFRHGSDEFDRNYPDGIPTTMELELAPPAAAPSETPSGAETLSSGLVMYPEGHARNKSGRLRDLLDHKFRLLAAHAVDDVDALADRCGNLAGKSAAEIRQLYDFQLISNT